MKRIPTVSIQAAWKAAFLILLFLTTTVIPTWAEGGVFIFKQSSSHPDGSATAARYTTYRRLGAISTFRLTEGRTIEVTQFQPLVVIAEVDHTRLTSINELDTPAYIISLESCKNAYNKYPNSRALLKPQIIELEDIVKRLRSGEVWFEGEWTTPAVVASTQSQRAVETELRKKQALQEQRDQQIEKEIEELKQRLGKVRQKLKEVAAKRDDLAERHRAAAESAKRSAETLIETVNK